MTSCTIKREQRILNELVVKGFQVKIFDELYHRRFREELQKLVVKGFQVKIFDELYHLAALQPNMDTGCERLSGQDL